MAGSRALKEVTLCKNHPKSGGKKEAAKVMPTKQYNHTGPKDTGPNYPQWNFGSGKGKVKGI